MIGWNPVVDDIRLTRGDFIMSRTNPLGPLPAGTTAEIEWATGEIWAATILGATVSWRIESEEVDEIDTGTAFTVWVRYPNDATETTDDYEWIVGYGRRFP